MERREGGRHKRSAEGWEKGGRERGNVAGWKGGRGEGRSKQGRYEEMKRYTQEKQGRINSRTEKHVNKEERCRQEGRKTGKNARKGGTARKSRKKEKQGKEARKRIKEEKQGREARKRNKE